MTTALITDPAFLLHDPGAGHPECPERLKTVLARLEDSPLKNQLKWIRPEPVERAYLEAVHTSAYIDWVEASFAAGRTILDNGDTRINQHSWQACLLAAGAAVDGVKHVVSGVVTNAFVAARPPGHHARPAEAMGFCLFGNVAVAARFAHRQLGIERILIVDWDVHHGNGTQEIFEEDDAICFVSLHQQYLWPGTGLNEETGRKRGRGFTHNFPLPAGSGDAEYERIFAEKIQPLADDFQPELVLVSAGFDAHRLDPLAEMNLSASGFAEMTKQVVALAEQHANGRLVSVLEGGYHLGALGDSVMAHIAVLADS